MAETKRKVKETEKEVKETKKEVKETKIINSNTPIVEKAKPVIPEKKPRKPREKVRSVEETIKIPETKLTEKEKINLIKDLKETVTFLNNKIDAAKQSAESAFNRARETEEKYAAMENYYRGELKYINSQLVAFHAAINQTMKGVI